MTPGSSLQDRTESSPTPAGDVREHLANERTYLAWVRTSITVVGLGFVVGKFGVWLRYLASASGSSPAPQWGHSVPLGAGMVIVGAALAVLGARRYRVVRRAFEQGGHVAAGASVVAVTLLVVVFAILILFLVAASIM